MGNRNIKQKDSHVFADKTLVDTDLRTLKLPNKEKYRRDARLEGLLSFLRRRGK